eukprot:UN00845
MGSKLTVDYPQVTCVMRSNANMRYDYYGLEVQVDAKRARMGVRSVALTLPSRWFDETENNLLITCHGIDIEHDALNAAIYTPIPNDYYLHIDGVKKTYSMIEEKDSYITPNRKY